MGIFKRLEFFTKEERWGDPERVNGALLLTLDALRRRIGLPFVIHCAYKRGGHAQNSQHYLGNAVDFHIEGIAFPQALALLELALAEHNLSEHVGLGIYPEWHTPGFHLDVRGTKARWGFVGGNYVSFAEARKTVAPA